MEKRIPPASFQNTTSTVSSAPEQLTFPGRTFYANARDVADALCREVTDIPLVGFDMEWKPQFTRGKPVPKTAVVQLCYPKVQQGGKHVYECLVIHVIHCGIPEGLKALLESPATKKVGVNIEGDARKLRSDYGVDIMGCIDIPLEARKRDLTSLVDQANTSIPAPGIPSRNLKGLCLQFLHKSLLKEKSIRCGNWEQIPLSQAQLKYAVLDAYASLRCYQELCLHPLLQSPVCNEGQSGAIDGACISKKCHGDQEMIPQSKAVKHLPPSKEAAYNLFMGYQGKDSCDLQKIADLQGVQLSTVESYIASAILSGRTYEWKLLGIQDCTVLKVGHCITAMIQNLQDNLDVGQATSESPQDVPTVVSNLQSILGDNLPPPGSLADISSIMKRYKCSLKELKEHVGPQIGYGTISLVLSHLSRLLTTSCESG